MDPALLRNDSSQAHVDGSPDLSKLPLPGSAAFKNGRVQTVNPRIDVEPVYTLLRAALGERFSEYKTALSQFVLGKLNQSELAGLLSPLLSPAPSVALPNTTTLVSTLHLHNTLTTSLYANLFRDPPTDPIAPFVLATDSPSAHGAKSSAGAGDKAEERLRREVMALTARDRRRIKGVRDEPGVVRTEAGLGEVLEYRTALAAKLNTGSGDATNGGVAQNGSGAAAAGGGGGGGGLSKTNWDLEIRRRYNMPLAAETLEFPGKNDIQARIEPICYEEEVKGGVALGMLGQCAELVETAVEMYVKEMLGSLFATARVNGEALVCTSKYKRQLAREEEAADRGKIVKNQAGYLPVEVEAMGRREPLNMDDLRMAIRLNEGRWCDPFAAARVMLEAGLDTLQEDRMVGVEQGLDGAVNGVKDDHDHHMEDAMAIDELGWQGASDQDRNALFSALDGLLAVAN